MRSGQVVSQATRMTDWRSERPFLTNVIYSQPTIGVGFMFFLMTVYLMKYSTDVLGISALTMGGILLLSRIWDAASDPLIGYLSDRTRSRLGRRRPWLLASAIPLAVTYVMIWSPPESLSGSALTAWIVVSVLLFYTAWTMLTIPHYSLGAELDDDYHRRTKLFGYRHAFGESGSMIAVIALYFLAVASEPGELMFVISAVAGLLTAMLIFGTVGFIRERTEFQGRGETHPVQAYLSVFRNKHARLLILVFLMGSVGQSFAAVLTPYISEYIIGAPESSSLFLFLYVSGSIVSVPFWVFLSQRFGKRNLWLTGEIVIGSCLGSFLFLEEGSVVHMGAVMFMIGLGAGAVSVVGPSIQADVIDYGEYMTGRRSEGAYFAAWNFIGKAATGLTFLITGLVLELSGFVPNVSQTEATRTWMLIGFSIIPMALYFVCAAVLYFFRLNESEHKEIQEELIRQRAAFTEEHSAIQQAS